MNKSYFTLLDTGRGNILLYGNQDSFFGGAYTAFSRFAIDIAHSDLNMEPLVGHYRDKTKKFITELIEKGHDLKIEDIDMELQARYEMALEDCLDVMVKIITSTVLTEYQQNQRIIKV